MAVAIVRTREIIERAEQGAREKADSCEVEALNYLEAIKKIRLWHKVGPQDEHRGLWPFDRTNQVD